MGGDARAIHAWRTQGTALCTKRLVSTHQSCLSAVRQERSCSSGGKQEARWCDSKLRIDQHAAPSQVWAGGLVPPSLSPLAHDPNMTTHSTCARAIVWSRVPRTCSLVLRVLRAPSSSPFFMRSCAYCCAQSGRCTMRRHYGLEHGRLRHGMEANAMHISELIMKPMQPKHNGLGTPSMSSSLPCPHL